MRGCVTSVGTVLDSVLIACWLLVLVLGWLWVLLICCGWVYWLDVLSLSFRFVRFGSWCF